MKIHIVRESIIPYICWADHREYPIPYTLYFKTELNIQMFNGTSLFCKEHNIIDNPANVK